MVETPAQSVTFEILMLLHAERRLRDFSRTRGWGELRADHAMALDSYLVHARALDEIFRAAGRPTDIKISFWTTETIEAPLSRQTAGRINTHLAHLTTLRAAKAGWSISGITTAIARALVQFLELMPPEVADEFEFAGVRAMNELRVRLGSPGLA